MRAVCLLATLWLSGCTAMLLGGSGGDTSGSPDGRAERAAGTVVEDDSISTAVADRLRADAYTASAAISVTSRDGVVTLRGQVPSYGAREQAARVARTTRGVVGVNNELTVRAE